MSDCTLPLYKTINLNKEYENNQSYDIHEEHSVFLSENNQPIATPQKSPP